LYIEHEVIFMAYHNKKEVIKSVLLNTGLFHNVEPELRNLFDLKTGGIEALLLASYGSAKSYYLYDEKWVIIPPREDDLLGCPPVPLRRLKIKDLKDYPPIKGLPLYDWKILSAITREEKYIILRSLSYSEIREYLTKINEISLKPISVLVAPIPEEIKPEWESCFDEYLAGIIFRNKGYLVTYQNFGIISGPDFFAYRAGTFGEGAFLLEILLGKRLREGRSEESTCLIEAEAQYRILDAKHGIAQALGYLFNSGGYIGQAYVSASQAAEYQVREAIKQGCGMITYNEKGDILYYKAKNYANREKQHELLESVKSFVKLLEKRNKNCPLIQRLDITSSNA